RSAIALADVGRLAAPTVAGPRPSDYSASPPNHHGNRHYGFDCRRRRGAFTAPGRSVRTFSLWGTRSSLSFNQGQPVHARLSRRHRSLALPRARRRLSSRVVPERPVIRSTTPRVAP